MMQAVRQVLIHTWYRSSYHLGTIFLLPFSWLFHFCITIRRYLYRIGIKKSHRFPVPVIVVGNITVGGTGKTPFVIWLAQFLKANGWKPGIVSRGVGGKKHMKPRKVSHDDAPHEVGDEAILLARNSHCQIVIGANRVAAVRELLRDSACDIVISDDGLQHYRLARDVEIAMVDGGRHFGNGCLLPAGPLREPVTRLDQVDFVVVNGKEMSLEPTQLISLKNKQKINLTEFPHKKVHAVAGIGHPEQFFHLLKKYGFDVIPRIFPDHHRYQPSDLDFSDSLPVIMTEKDAVKCESFIDERYWYLAVNVKINDELHERLLTKIGGLK